jgi:hypothetical protein
LGEGHSVHPLDTAAPVIRLGIPLGWPRPDPESCTMWPRRAGTSGRRRGLTPPTRVGLTDFPSHATSCIGCYRDMDCELAVAWGRTVWYSLCAPALRPTP